jgi:hypothetical protein
MLNIYSVLLDCMTYLWFSILISITLCLQILFSHWDNKEYLILEISSHVCYNLKAFYISDIWNWKIKIRTRDVAQWWSACWAFTRSCFQYILRESLCPCFLIFKIYHHLTYFIELLWGIKWVNIWKWLKPILGIYHCIYICCHHSCCDIIIIYITITIIIILVIHSGFSAHYVLPIFLYMSKYLSFSKHILNP